MNILVIVLPAAVVFYAAYRVYGGWLSRLLKLDDTTVTPAVAMRNDVDYIPTEPRFLLSQHFSAIAAAGPIVGPILAGVWFGWGPALIWIVLGSIFVGGVHDIASLVASLRHRGRSIAQVVKEHMSGRAYVLFLIFIWITLVYIIVAFTDIVASSFVGRKVLENGSVVEGGATASSSLLYLVLPVIMGLLLRYSKLSVGWATVIFLPLVGLAIAAGPWVPLNLDAMLGVSEATAIRIWDVLLLAYCMVAAGVPMWLLLQPRGHLGGYFLFIALAGMVAGMLVGSVWGWLGGGGASMTIEYPAFVMADAGRSGPVFPMLFITIACGACSGFHCLIASGTTSKQLRRESDAKLVGYGAMVLEGMVAVGSLATVMLLSLDAARGKDPNLIYAQGNAVFLGALGVPASFGISFALLAFTTFVYDTLDVCTRLGRYILQELTGWETRAGRWTATAVTAAVPLFFVTQKAVDAAGRPIPAWKTFWPLFGASNQLMAALALLGVTVWLYRSGRFGRAWIVTLLPTGWMYGMSAWALLRFVKQGVVTEDGWKSPVPWAAAVLVGLAGLLLIEAARLIGRRTAGEEVSVAA
ncbi:MAG: carbon starvation protein A [Phycisphaeraceae bacterium]|nr:carbon starvation protein A [Phycisphaeraceae bacterium]